MTMILRMLKTLLPADDDQLSDEWRSDAKLTEGRNWHHGPSWKWPERTSAKVLPFERGRA
jgi:hypothetical protein